MNRINIAGTLALAGAMLGATPALADSISPASYSAALDVGESVTIKKTVTVSAGRPTTARADIFFLTDTTGSMGGTINTVKSNFGAIAAGLGGDIAFGVGQFKDVGDVFAYNLDQDITTSIATAQAAIDTWSASGGGDFPEQALYALSEVANTTSWRAGAKKIVLLAGDAPAKTDLKSQADVVSDLVAAGVTVESIDVGGLNSDGQFDGAGSIYAGGVAGEYFTSFGADLVDTIDAAIGSAFANYSNVTLGIAGVPAGVGVSFTPIGGISGLFDRSIERSFDFDLTFTGLTPGTYDFSIYGLVDGGIVATELDSITVSGSVPEPTTWAMMIFGLFAVGSTMRRRKTALAFS
jgi:hypothetical protein